MDIFSLFLLYYLTQKPALLESIKPFAQLLKNSEESLKFLDDLKAFAAIFDNATTKIAQDEQAKNQTAQSAGQGASAGQPYAQSAQTQNKNRQSPFQGIADEVLQQYLDEYLIGNTKP